jgi:hypothetical protein
MNLAVNWKEKHEKGGYSLVKSLVHEVFHCLGFNHSSNPQSVNYWQYIENDEIIITQDDIDSIRSFYGFKYDLEFLKLWIKTSDFLHLLNSRMIVKLGQLIGINLDPNQQKIHNIKLIKNKLGI